jgi:membrane fusion protein (multidrug efflux system)
MKAIHWILMITIGMMCTGCKPPQEDAPAGTADNAAQVAAEAEVTQTVPVEAMVIHAQSVQENLTLNGVLEPYYSVDLMAEVSGKVTAIRKKLGERVTTKDTLAVIDDRIPWHQYQQAKAQMLSAENNLKIVELNFKSDEELFKSGDISKLAYESSLLAQKSAEANLLAEKANFSLLEKSFRDTRIMSPINGVISRKYVELGAMVNMQMPVYRVVDLNLLKVRVGVPQDMVQRIRRGSRAQIEISAMNSEMFTGSVESISPQADEATGTFLTEVIVKNTSDTRIKGGMSAKVHLVMQELGNRIAVPDYTLLSKDGREHIYRINAGVAYLTPVEVSENFGSQKILASGLADGDTIVVVGMKNLGMKTPVEMENLVEN